MGGVCGEERSGNTHLEARAANPAAERHPAPPLIGHLAGGAASISKPTWRREPRYASDRGDVVGDSYLQSVAARCLPQAQRASACMLPPGALGGQRDGDLLRR